MLDDPNPVAAYDSAVGLPRDRPAPPCRLTDWKPWPMPNPSLLGHATVAFNSGWVINSIPIFKRADGSFSAGSPSIPVLDRDGRHKIGADGKKQYTQVMGYEGAGRELWSRTIVGALLAAGIDPSAGAGGA